MTLLGAVAAAGGVLYAADANTVNVIRTGKAGEKVLFEADLEKIKRGESSDIPVQAGDVIEVSYSSLKIVPYGVYSFLRTMVHVGAYMPTY
jgi:protein involved in polysaccharide export with SLBB domain